MDTIYLDYQATTPVHNQVLLKMNKHWSECFGNPHSTEHFLGWQANEAVEFARKRIAHLVGAFPEDVIFTSGATEANNIAILGHEANLSRKKNTIILLSSIEHKCVSEANSYLSRRSNCELATIAVNSYGEIDMEGLETQLKLNPYLVSVMLINNEIGTVQNIKAIYNLCQSHGAFLHCDASQAPTVLDISWLADHTDSISISSHKMYGPKGVGALIVNPKVKDSIQPLIHGGGQEGGLRSGTLPVPLCVGFGEACVLVRSDQFRTRIKEASKLRDTFVEELLNTRFEIKLNGPPLDKRHLTNANIMFSGFKAKELLDKLQPHICASSGSACTSGLNKGSETLRAIGLNPSEVDSSIRFSFGLKNHHSELEIALNLIIEALIDEDH